MRLIRIRAFILIAGLAAATLTVPSALTKPALADEAEFALVFPQTPEVTEFVDSWGNARSGGRRHRGTDLLAPQMTPVVAAADGIVKKFGNGPRSGYYIVLTHRDGYETWYMHLNNDAPGTDNGRGGPELAYAEGLEIGDPVEAGQVIAYVGDSGNAEWTTHHTHFELHLNGRAINPYPFLAAAWERWELEMLIESEEVPFS